MEHRTNAHKLFLWLLAPLFALCAALALAVLLPGYARTAHAAESGHTEHGAGWTALSADGGTLTGGNYYLASDVTLTTDLTVSGTVTLCLNGYVLTGTGSGAVIMVGSGGDFTLCDCREGAADVANEINGVPYNSGVITGGTGRRGDTTAGGGIRADYDTVFTLNGGAIVGNRADLGGGVYACGDAFIMNGGTIAGNTATGDIFSDGGGVYVLDCAFTMNGGTIARNTAESGGGGVYMIGDVFTMKGGTIADNTAQSGSGVLLSYSSFTINGGYFGAGSIAGDTASILGGYFAEDPRTYVDAGYFNEETHTVVTLSEEEHYGDGDFDADYSYAVYRAPSGYDIEDLEITYGTAYAPATSYAVQNAAVTYSWEETSGEGASANGTGTGLPQNAGIYTVTVTFAAGIDVANKVCFPQGTAAFTVVIGKADYDMSGVSFEDATYTYDGGEKTLTVTGALPEGVTVSYSANTLTDAGELEVTATFTGEDTDNYNAIDPMTATLTIRKATYDMSGVSFEDATYTYDGGEKTLTVTGALPEGVTVSYSANTLTDAGELEVTATFTGEDTDNYNAIAPMTATLTIDKATPVYELPEGLTAKEGQTLSEIALPAGWAWEEAALSVGEAGEKTFAAVYTPADTANYAAARVALTVTVEPLLSGGAIAGIAIGCTAGALLIAYGALAFCFKKGVVKGAFFARIYPFIK